MRPVRPLLLLALLLLPALADAQSATALPDSQRLRGLAWRSVGPNRGGRSLAVAGSVARPQEYYFGAVGGGLWKTVDGGQSWRPVTDGQIRSSSVGAMAVAESNPDVVYIGMGETALRGNIMQGDGVYRSRDAGKTWQHVGLAETMAIGRLRVHPTNPDIVWVAAFGNPSRPSAERGVYKTTDGGATWRRVLFRNDSTGAVDITIDPSNPEVLYASLWQAYRITWQMSSGGTGSGLFKSTDGGETWTEITRNPGLPASGVLGKIGVSAAPGGKRVYAIVEHPDGGVFRSDDNGATWTRLNDERKLRQRAFYYSHIHADPVNPDRVYVLNVSFWRSDDGGRTFPTSIQGAHGDYHDLWIARTDNQRMVAGDDGGGSVSVTGGQSWTALDFPTAQLYHISVTGDVPYHVCGAQQDNSTMCLPSRGWANLRGARSDRLGDWMYDVGGGESGYITNDPRNPDIFYAGSQGALLTRYNRRNGQIRDVQVYPRFFSGEPASSLPERWQWTYPIVFSPVDPRILYTSSQHLWKSVDEGQSWTRISPDLTRADPSTLGPTGGPITKDMNGPEIYATIFAVAPAPQDVNVIWTGSDDGLVHVTRDGGRSWANVTPPALPAFARVSIIDASPHALGTATVAAKHYLRGDRAPYIFRTTDFGRTWARVTDGIRADDYVHVVREDPRRAGMLYAGTEHGIYVSWDAGRQWRSLALNLPDVQVSDLQVVGSDLVIGTHGRSAYVLDDIEALRSWDRAAARLRVLAARPAIRGITEGLIEYELPTRADSVTIEIRDSTGTVVRRYSGGAAPLPPVDSAALRDTIRNPVGCETDRRARGGGRPGGLPGLNRFVWDLRTTGATVFPCMIIWSASPQNGPMVVPGRYLAVVRAGSQVDSTRLIVQADPNLVGITAAHLREQHALALRIRDQVSAANDAVVRIRALRSGIHQRLGTGTPGAELSAAGRTAAERLLAIEEELYQVRNRSGQDPLNFPIKLNNRLAALGRSVQTGHARPTAGAYKVFTELSAELRAVLQRLDAVVRSDVAAFNRAAQSQGVAPVTQQ